MTKQEQSNAGATTPKVEGEGSYTGARRYNDRLQKHIEDEDVEAQAEEAKRALQGEEREELQEAERQAKRGPLPPRPAPSQR
jgi:hypothetical protein